jgi:hypothetical protein
MFRVSRWRDCRNDHLVSKVLERSRRACFIAKGLAEALQEGRDNGGISPPLFGSFASNPPFEMSNCNVLARQPDIAQHVIAELRQSLLRAIENEASNIALQSAADDPVAAFPEG